MVREIEDGPKEKGRLIKDGLFRRGISRERWTEREKNRDIDYSAKMVKIYPVSYRLDISSWGRNGFDGDGET